METIFLRLSLLLFFVSIAWCTAHSSSVEEPSPLCEEELLSVVGDVYYEKEDRVLGSIRRFFLERHIKAVAAKLAAHCKERPEDCTVLWATQKANAHYLARTKWRGRSVVAAIALFAAGVFALVQKHLDPVVTGAIVGVGMAAVFNWAAPILHPFQSWAQFRGSRSATTNDDKRKLTQEAERSILDYQERLIGNQPNLLTFMAGILAHMNGEGNAAFTLTQTQYESNREHAAFIFASLIVDYRHLYIGVNPAHPALSRIFDRYFPPEHPIREDDAFWKKVREKVLAFMQEEEELVLSELEQDLDTLIENWKRFSLPE